MTQNHNMGHLNYEINAHHKQILKSKINPQLIDRIEISTTPSDNYKNVYKNLYMDQLQKTINQHQFKKSNHQQQQSIELNLYNKNINLKNNYHESACTPYSTENGSIFRNYDDQRNRNIQQHILKNYDSNYMFKSQDKYQHHKQKQIQINNQTLQQQLSHHDYHKNINKQNKVEENKALQLQLHRQKQIEYQNRMQKELEKIQYRQEMKKQIQHEQNLKRKKSYFVYNNIARHNPITNPIEYHIDNPYILTKIQNKSAVIR